jgi:beta-lactamase regulating signal transducer with metallopeptidase domain
VSLLDATQLGFAPALASALLHSLWQNGVLALMAAATLRVGLRWSPALRHAVGMGFLLAMAVVPALTFLQFWQQARVDLSGGWLPAITAPQFDAVHGGYVQQATVLPGLLVVLWLLGVALVLLRHLASWRTLRALDRQGFEGLPRDWQACLDRMRHALGIGREVLVRVSAHVTGPFTAYCLRPVIWLPLSLLTRLPREQLEALLAHELAHVARCDWLWNGLQCLLESLLFFHPATWWLGRLIRHERELACDELAVQASGDAIALAEALVHLERRRHPGDGLTLAARGGSLMKRITRLLDPPPQRPRWGSRSAAVLLFACGALALSQAGISAQGPSRLHIYSTTDGVPGPGDVREIKAESMGIERYYRASIDAQGELVEVYRENGLQRAIDSDVRAWLAEVGRLSAPPPPPAPPAPPSPPGSSAWGASPPALALPPAPPLPPPPPEIADDLVFKSLLREVLRHDAVVARVGSPVALASDAVSGHISLQEALRPTGEAELQFAVSGPKGQSRVEVDARVDDGSWTLDRVDLADR